MISVRQACQDLADGDASAAAAEALPEEGVAEIDLAADTPEGGGDGKGAIADGEGGGRVGGDAQAGVEAGGSKGGSNGGEEGEDADGDADGEGGGGGDGVPISVSCSEDGKTVAIVVSG